jgi:cytochrome c553
MTRRWFVGWFLLPVLSSPAAAEPSTRVAWTPEVLRTVRAGDAGKGMQLAEGCQACHGENRAAELPSLDGQLATYLYRQLRDYQDGSRQHPVMSAIASGLSEVDMVNLAAFYSTLPASGAKRDPRTAPDLVVRGDSKRLIPPCGICHGGKGQGEPVDTPRLAGQSQAYLRDTLLAYRSGQRHNDIYRRMRAMAERLSAEEIDELAAYYASLE